MLHGGIDTEITLTQDGKEVHFGEKVHTTKGILFVAKILRCATLGIRLGLVSVIAKPKRGKQRVTNNASMQTKRTGKANMAVPMKRTLHVNTAHQLLGHMGERATRAIGKHLGWTIVRSAFRPCVACTKAKIKTKAIVPDGLH